MKETVSLPDGQYPAKITDYGIMESKAGKPMVLVKLKVWQNKETSHLMAWFGGLSKELGAGKAQSAREWTLGALQKISAAITLNALIDKTQNGLDEIKLIGTDVSVTVANEPHHVTNVMTSKIKYINSVKKFDRLKGSTLALLRDEAASPFSEFDDLPF